MNQVILIHGAPEDEREYYEYPDSPSNAHWFPWIQKELCKHEVISVAPEMPKPYDPFYEDWVKVFEQFKISNETTVIGHSCGAGFLLRYFSEHSNLVVKKIILVAPWIDPEPKELSTDFFGFTFDSDLSKRISLSIFTSTDDYDPCIKSLAIIEKELPNVNYHRFTDKGHFVDSSLGTKAFPELLEEILK